MQTYSASEQRLLNKLRQLSPEKLSQVEDFIDFLSQQSEARQLTYSAAKLSEPVLHKIWDNPDDAEYDSL